MTQKLDFDVVIIGGGVAGLAVFQELQSDFRVCLLEAKSLFSGASGGSLRIMHSGLRYLKSGRVDLFLDSLKCQRRIKANFVALTEQRPFVAPAPRILSKMLGTQTPPDIFLPVPNPISWNELLLLNPLGLASALATSTNDSEIKENSPVISVSGGGELFNLVFRDTKVGGVKHELKAKVVINCAGAAIRNIGCNELEVSRRLFAARPKFVRAWNVITSIPYNGPIFALNGLERMVVGTPRAGELVVGTGYGLSESGTWYVSNEERTALLKDFGLSPNVIKGVEGGMLAVNRGKGIKFLGADLINCDGNYAEAFAAKFVTFPALGRKLRNWVNSRISIR
jgi:glycerol-3-phosphate dehydrogenase